MTRKRRILFCSEAHYLFTGYATYSKEILKRLSKCDDFVVAEHAMYGALGDKRDANANWIYYPNAVQPEDPRWQDYKSSPVNEFGQWRFERILLDFKPDIVCDIRDYWMTSYQGKSPLRPYFNWVWMPTIDSVPQRDEWVEDYISADGIFTYSDWAIKELQEHSAGKINLLGSASPGINPDVLKPVKNKAAHKQAMSFDPDSIVIGTVMRNQVRKLYPDLFRMFRTFLDNTTPEIAKKSYLYIHTAYPDISGWSIPELIKEFGLGGKILVTYLCRTTNKPFVTYYQGGKTYSPYSNSPTAVLPTVSHGLDIENLANIYNLFDAYIQYSICEGFGMPQVEAAACGVPVMAVDYSAMADVVKKTGGIPIPYDRKFKELGTEAYRVYPDNNRCAELVDEFCRKSPEERQALANTARQAVLDNYTWDRTADIWINHLRNVELTGRQGQWGNHPADLKDVPTQMPETNNIPQLVNWFYDEVSNQPDMKYSLAAASLLRDLNLGVRKEGVRTTKIDKEKTFKSFQTAGQNKNLCEKCRTGMVQIESEDFIDYAHAKAKNMGLSWQ